MYVFAIQLTYGTIKNVLKPKRKWEIQCGGIQTGSTYINIRLGHMVFLVVLLDFWTPKK